MTMMGEFLATAPKNPDIKLTGRDIGGYKSEPPTPGSASGSRLNT
jgi:hypothetical protein